MTRGGIALGGVLVAVALVLPSHAEEPATDGAMTVSVVRPARRCFTERFSASGVFVASHEVELRAERDGLVVSDVLAEPGDAVAQGQVLARLVAPQAPTQPIEMKAPVAGVVLAASATIGAYTSPAAPDPLFRIAADGALELRAEIVVGSLPRLRKDMAATIHVLGLGDVEGRVAAIDTGVDAQTQLGSVRLSIAKDARLRVGGFARADIEAGQDCGLAVPLSALLFGPDGAVVGTVQAGRVAMRLVTTGQQDGGAAEIREGLSADDLVIARAGPFLRDGDHVRPVSSAP